MGKHILIVEDEGKVSRLLQLELMHEGYEVEVVEDGRAALDKVSSQTWDLILLDIMLPEMTGIEVLRRLRKAGNDTPVILLTARNSTPDKVSGLDLGANDYITKPFEIEELLARMRACMRNRTDEKENSRMRIQVGDLIANKNTREVIRGDLRIDLTPKEYDLLLYLMENKNHVLEREQIINRIWGYDFPGDTNIVDVYVRYIRRKIDYNHPDKLIQTIRGVGYSIREVRT